MIARFFTDFSLSLSLLSAFLPFIKQIKSEVFLYMEMISAFLLNQHKNFNIRKKRYILSRLEVQRLDILFRLNINDLLNLYVYLSWR